MSLEIELRPLTEGTNKLEWTPTSSELDLSEEDLGLDGPTKVILNLIKTGGSLVAHCEIAFHLRLACCRCLDPIHRDVETAVDLIFQKGKIQPDSTYIKLMRELPFFWRHSYWCCFDVETHNIPKCNLADSDIIS